MTGSPRKSYTQRHFGIACLTRHATSRGASNAFLLFKGVCVERDVTWRSLPKQLVLYARSPRAGPLVICFQLDTRVDTGQQGGGTGVNGECSSNTCRRSGAPLSPPVKAIGRIAMTFWQW